MRNDPTAEIITGSGSSPEKALDSVSYTLKQLQEKRLTVHKISEPCVVYDARAVSSTLAWTASVTIVRDGHPRYTPNP